MRHVIGYVTVFVSGFAACAAILQFSGVGGTKLTTAAAPRPTIQEVLAPHNPESGSRKNIAGLPSIADAVAQVEPAVVNIDITGTRQARGPFGFMRSGSEEFSGSGSGIILSEDGYIVTNNHVVEPVADRSGEITIRLASGKEYSNVTIVGRDPQTDLAVLKVHGANNLPTAELGDSENLRVGDWAIAIGNPLGFNSTVTLGIVSAVNRRGFRNDTDALDKVIQTDAAINPGNSGGALADIEGRVIGINTAIASQTGGSVGIGFAIPINNARRIIDQLIQQGKVTRPYLGIAYLPVESVAAESLPPNVILPPDKKGALLMTSGNGQAIRPGSPAAKAGMQEYDIIRAIDGKPVDDVRVVKEQVQNHNAGETVNVTIWRNGETQELTVTLEAMPEDYSMRNFRSRRFYNPE